ncbi:MAG TPA: ELWxxDGT repeat protein [Thermoanaerobaculia bacterium]|nr:ELWxxDGT repeat protein [Thermoanaerobaculia bacterium]
MRRIILALLVLASASASAEAPRLLRDLATAGDVNHSYPQYFTTVGRNVFFTVREEELWKTDGTPEGTRFVQDIDWYDGLADGEQHGRPFASAGLLYFRLDRRIPFGSFMESHELHLWRSDGTEEGTFELHAMPGICDYTYQSDAAPLGDGGAIFTYPCENSGVWVTDGTAQGTKPLFSDFTPTTLVSAGGVAYFTRDRAIWRTDGTAGGTRKVYDLDAGDSGRLEEPVLDRNGDVFLLVSRSGRYEVLRDPGSGPLELAGSVGDGLGSRITALDGIVYIASRSGARTDLLRVDGMTRIRRVLSFPGGPGHVFTATASHLYFQILTDSSHGTWWRSDGTRAGTTSIGETWLTPAEQTASTPSRLFVNAADLYTADFSSSLTAVRDDAQWDLGAAGEQVLFGGFDPEHGYELWITDGTAAGTRLLANIRPDHGSYPAGGTRVGDRLLFHAYRTPEYEVWMTDGTAAGTSMLPVPSLRVPAIFADLGDGDAVIFNGKTLFRTDGTSAGTHTVETISTRLATRSIFKQAGRQTLLYVQPDGMTTEIWRTDGTESGTLLVTKQTTGRSYVWPEVAGDFLYYAAGRKLWRTDGTAGGSVELADEPRLLAPAGNRLFFATGDELWVTDGSPAGTSQVTTAGVRWIQATEGSVLFATADTVWRSDGTAAGTSAVKRIGPSYGGRAIGNVAYFAADDGIHGFELWRSDGTASGTRLVADIAPGPASSTPTALTVLGNRLWFAADDGRHGREPWTSDGTATTLLGDVNAGSAASNPEGFRLFGDKIFFGAASDATGYEPWVYDLPRPPRRRSAGR